MAPKTVQMDVLACFPGFDPKDSVKSYVRKIYKHAAKIFTIYDYITHIFYSQPAGRSLVLDVSDYVTDNTRFDY